MRLPSSSFRSRRAFTLIEILLATAVAAIVLIVIQSVFFGALRLRNTTADRIDDDLALHRALDFVQHDLAGLMIPGGVLSGEFQTDTTLNLDDGVEGQRVSPDLYTDSGRVDARTPFADVQRVAYYLTPAADGSGHHDLVRLVSRNLLPVQDESAAGQTLLTDVAAVTFEYFDGIEWTDTWDSTATNTLPVAIRYSVQLKPLDGQPARAPIVGVVPIVVSTIQVDPDTSDATGDSAS